jgi:hypothetical protein
MDSFYHERIAGGITIALAIVAAIWVGLAVNDDAPRAAINTTVAVAAVGWIVAARSRWWAVFPAFVAFGGIFFVGFKLRLHELGLVICGAALLPHLIGRFTERLQHRRPLPAAFVLLCGYIVLHALYSFARFKLDGGGGGTGNMARSYMNALWPLIFGFLFYTFGESRWCRLALNLLLLGAFLRVVVGLLRAFDVPFWYIPGLNFVALGAAEGMGGTNDLRTSGFLLGTAALAASLVPQGSIARLLKLFLFALGAGALVLGGGRVLFVSFGLVILLTLLLYRQFLALAAFALAGISLVYVLNTDLHRLDFLPDNIKRTLSVLVISEQRSSFAGLTTLSDEYHERLGEEGLQRWSQHPGTIVFGNPIKPIDSDYGQQSTVYQVTLQRLVDNAARTGSYESALWSVLAVFGVIGALLWTWLTLRLTRGFIPRLWRERIASPYHAILYLCLVQFAVLAGFCWISGSYPGLELALAFIGRGAIEDHEAAIAARETAETAAASAPVDAAPFFDPFAPASTHNPPTTS